MCSTCLSTLWPFEFQMSLGPKWHHLLKPRQRRKITRQCSNMAINSACINASVTIYLRELVDIVKYKSDPWSRRWLEAVRTRWGLRCSRFQLDTTLRCSTINSNNKNIFYILNGTRHQVGVQGTKKHAWQRFLCWALLIYIHTALGHLIFFVGAFR